MNKEQENKQNKQEIKDLGINLEATESIKKKKLVGTGIIDDKNIYATYPHKCKKCGHDKAQVIDLGIWYSDEAGVIRFKCGKCGFAEQTADSNT